MRKARTSRRRSAGVKEKKRRALAIVNDINEVVFCELVKEGDEAFLAAVCFYVVFLKEHVTNLAHRPRRLNELPDACANGI